MNWIIFSLLSVVSFSVANLYQRLAMRDGRSDAVTSSVIFQFLLTAVTALVVPFFGFHWPPASSWPYIAVASALYAAGTVFGFRAVRVIEASEITVLTGFGTIVTLFASFLFLGDRLNPMQWLGVALILMAVFLIKYEKKSFRFNNGVVFALLNTSLYGLAVVIDGYVLKTYDSFSYIPLVSFFPGFLLMAAYPSRLPRLLHDVKRINRNLLVYGILYAAAAEFFYIPLRLGALVSQASVILRASIVLTVLLAIVFLRERSHPWKKLIGAILTTLGVLFIQ